MVDIHDGAGKVMNAHMIGDIVDHAAVAPLAFLKGPLDLVASGDLFFKQLIGGFPLDGALFDPFFQKAVHQCQAAFLGFQLSG